PSRDAWSEVHVGSPTDNQIETTGYGAVIGGRDHVFFSSEPISVDEDELQFTGQTGLAAEDEVHLFEGDAIMFEGFGLMRNGGDFGAGAWRTGEGAVEGRIVGREGGELSVALPGSPQADTVEIRVAGEAIDATIDNGTVSFPVEISGMDGYKPFEIRWTP
ncbi:MAG: hypothetical protein R6U98_06440, partial [Pirellulaceae bacterium]